MPLPVTIQRVTHPVTVQRVTHPATIQRVTHPVTIQRVTQPITYINQTYLLYRIIIIIYTLIPPTYNINLILFSTATTIHDKPRKETTRTTRRLPLL